MPCVVSNPYQVPVSFHIFNRPDSTLEVFNQIRKIRPGKLFITADGPRDNAPGDEEKCSRARKIADEVDWDCEVFRNFSEANKGSFKSTSEGISWVFEHVDRAVILEDDCIPNHSFFRFCHELLEYYENDSRISLIAGNNFLRGSYKTEYSYHFSRFSHMWGWATWKRTWEQVDFTMSKWPEFRNMGGLKINFRKKYEIAFWDNLMQGMYEGKRGPHWDYLLMLSMYMNNTLAVKPGVNLVTNVGFDSDATNFEHKSFMHDIKTEEMDFPLNHPPCVYRHVAADDFVQSRVFGGRRSQYIQDRIAQLLPKPVASRLRKIKRAVFSKRY